ncbi:hypothetical protein ILUMI_03151 [Ignelater luminosus]|uniref:Equilibrative nucleoside transporter 3 n=1 Tax=Ignelater luminosus TaxID=2038154 RepID=A0A8K0DGV7_IGNLU|nr:hypothetical protein ILUMI_03151 [Ignelater luminosus]
MEVNTQPLLENSDWESDNEEEIKISNYHEDHHVVPVRNEKPLFKPQEPKDKYFMAYFIFYLLGMTTLLSWNFFITADDYWMYKFRDPNSKLTLVSPPPKRTPLQASFTSYLSIASNLPNIAFLALNTVLSHRISLQTRMIGSLLMMLLLFIITTVFVKVDTDPWQQQFFILTLTTVVLLNASSAVLSGSIFGIIGKFSPKYITAVIGGQALGGMFAAVAEIIALSVGASSVHSAFVYFMVGNIMILISLVCYIVLSKTVFFKFHLSDKMGVSLNEFQNELVRPRIVCYKTIYKKIWPYGISAFLVFAITLCIYPGVTVLIESEGKGHGYKWNDIYFVPVVAYLIFSCGDYLGRLLAGILQWPRKGYLLVTFNLLRLVFIPLLIFCNAQPRGHLPVAFDRDYYYILIIILFAITNGYLANLSVMCAPRVVDQHEKETASSMMAVFIGIGLTVGSAISLIIVRYL